MGLHRIRTDLRPLTVLAALCPVLAGLVGCGGGSTEPAAAGPVLRLAQVVEPTEMDPAKVQDGPTIELLMHLFEGLVQWDTNNQIVPCLAERWEVSDGGRTYTFHIRAGVKFHNGRELTAEDLAYSLRRSLDPKTGSAVAMTYLDDLVGAAAFNSGAATDLPGVEVLDPRTLRLQIDQPKAYFLAKLTYATGYAVCKEAIENETASYPERIVGTGPFRLARYDRGDRVVLDAFPDYWEGAPRLARVERRILLQDSPRHDKFEAGELDICPIPMAAYRADRENPEFAPKLKLFERPSVYYLALNQKAFPPFRDRRVRQAFAMAVDKQLIIDSVHAGVPRRAEGVVPYGVPGHDESFRGLPHDPGRARALLAEAGFPGGQGFPPLTISFRADNEDIRNTAVAVADQIRRNLGVTVQPEDVEWGTFLDRRDQGVMPFYFLRWAADYLDPQNFLSTMLHSKARQNTLGYSNPEFDRLCDQADVAQDPTARMALYRRAERIVVDDAPWVPIYFQKDVELWNPKLRGVETGLMGHLPHKRTYFAP